MKRTMLKALLTVIILVGTISAAVMVAKSKPEAERRPAGEKAEAVEVLEVHPGKNQVVLTGWGTVVPARQVGLAPQVNGKVVSVSEHLVPGALVSKGEILVRLDPRDYQLAVKQETSRVHKAELDLELERGRREVAEVEWKAMAGAPEGGRLARRIPQLEVAKVALEAAKSALARARLNLERTVVRAPFDAVVVDKKVEVGQLVGPGAPMVQLVGTERMWIEVPMKVSDVSYLSVPGVGGVTTGSDATVRQHLTDGRVISRQGRVIRLEGLLDQSTRMATVLVEADSPFDPSLGFPLLPGAYVEVEFHGRSKDGSYMLPRAAMREGGTVWLADSRDRLVIEQVEIFWTGRDRVLVVGGLSDGDRIVTSPISEPIAGMLLRPVPSDESRSRDML